MRCVDGGVYHRNNVVGEFAYHVVAIPDRALHFRITVLSCQETDKREMMANQAFKPDEYPAGPRAAAVPQPDGLAEAEVAARRKDGLVNSYPTAHTRTYAQILVTNVFTFFNSALFGLGAALIILGRPTDALVVVGIVMINVLVSVIQETRAKRLLDRIALLARPQATVIRGGRVRTIAVEEVVRGDTLRVQPGDQFVVDGVTVAGRGEVDESLLTGESEVIPKTTGDVVSSGTFCVSGMLYYEAVKVGEQSIVHRLTQQARRFRGELTPLQREVNLLIQVVLLVAVFFEILVLGNGVIDHLSLLRMVQRSAVVLAIIPVGLFLAISVAYALGAVRLAGQGLLIQQANVIESLSHVDMLCLDKTGTLTTNTLRVQETAPLLTEQSGLHQLLGDFAANLSSQNRTITAIAHAFPGTKREVRAEVAFSSARYWRALTCSSRLGGDEVMTYLLGAPEALAGALTATQQSTIARQQAHLIEQGLRVVLFASSNIPLRGDAAEAAQLPPALTPLGLVALSDTVRPDARQLLTALAESGVQVKIISGDHPQTVLSTVRQAGLVSGLTLVSGPELDEMTEAEFTQAAQEATIFGRIVPRQKERLVQTLRAGGHYVAMIGDGVNDVPALKEANVGIVMRSGSQATRSVADMVLLNDTFAPLSTAFIEGLRIRTGLHRVVTLFLARMIFEAIMILAVVAMTDSFAFTPKQNSILAFLTGAVPALALAAWAQAPQPPRQRKSSLFADALHISVPASLMMSVFGMGIFIGFSIITGASAGVGQERLAQTALTIFGLLCDMALMVFIAPPTRFWAIRGPVTNDWRPSLLAAGLVALFLMLFAIPALRNFFELVTLTFAESCLLVGLALAWMGATYLSWRWHVLERFLRLTAT